jgi:hypothetical protein
VGGNRENCGHNIREAFGVGRYVDYILVIVHYVILCKTEMKFISCLPQIFCQAFILTS